MTIVNHWENAEIKQVPLDELVLDPDNTNEHSQEQIDNFVEGIKYYGFRWPLLVSRLSNIVKAGAGRYLAAKQLGMKTVPVVFQDFNDEDQERGFGIFDNGISNQARMNFGKVNLEMGKFGPDFDIKMLAIPEWEIEVADKQLGDEEHIPENVEPKTKLGDLYQLGEHRLLCGDSTNIQNVERLMDGNKSDITFTSPPYNLGNNAKLRGYNGDGDDSAYLTKSDHKTSDEYLQFLKDFTSLCLQFSEYSFINIQILAGNKFIFSEYWNHFKNNLCDLMIWDKEHAQPSAARRVLNSVFEFIFIFHNEINPSRAINIGKEFRGTIQNVYRLNPNGKKDPLAKDHKAVFPVQFAEFFVNQFSEKSVFDPFGGSGSTLIACEKTNRKCFMMELDPHYCDVIVARWNKYTDKTAVLLCN